ncbi:MAG TPA: ABC transporter permease [Feifaniaceae bacterium]|nr:ABC transporter permease [Feifaniaceae bacterium]
MNKGFYFKLARSNVMRSRQVYVPYFLATAIISGVYFLILAMIFSPGLKNVPGGETAQGMFVAGVIVFTLFAFFFMLYINAFLVKRRKKEFGLYSVLGMNRRQVARVLKWENLIVVGAGVTAGILLGMAVGRLLFMLLMHMLHAAEGSAFVLPWFAFAGTALLFFAVFVTTSLYNGVRIRVTDTAELLKSDRKGEKESKTVVPATVIGLLLLGIAYLVAIFSNDMAVAIGLFFPAAFLVIIATFLLFHAGSIAFLRLLRRNRKLYYKPENFISISSMFHRMRQNARGLASICVFSTMLIVTVSGTSALYLGQEQILREMHPYGLRMSLRDLDAGSYAEVDGILGKLAAKYGVELVGSPEKLVTPENAPKNNMGHIVRYENSEFTQLEHGLVLDQILMLDIRGAEEDGAAFVAAFEDAMLERYGEFSGVSDIYSARTEGYGVYGGLLFLGVFFGVLFLAVTVLMIYFKQVTEGQEDKERFEILQKVGMQSEEVKDTINKQILWVFFLPLIGALMHIFAASNMISKMLEVFSLFDKTLTLGCILVTSAVFALVYLIVYRQTANVYYKMVRR